jgi:hypothetical protein
MSQWGKLDRVNLQGTATVAQNFANVVFSQSQTGNVAIGYALVVANVEYTIANIANSTIVTLDVPYTGSSAASQDGLAIQQQPKTLRTYGWGANLLLGANTVNTRNVYGVDVIEASDPTNKAKGISHTGWSHYQTWVTTIGAVRNRSEVLVAMSKNFNANSDASLNVASTFYQDAYDDTILEDYYLYYSRQPSVNGLAANITAGRPGASYGVTGVVQSTFGGAAVSYKWQKSPNNIVWTDVIDAPYAGNVGFSGNTTANLVISNVYIGWPNASTSNIFLRVIISANTSVGAAGVTSNTSANVQVLALGL